MMWGRHVDGIITVSIVTDVSQTLVPRLDMNERDK